MDLTGPQGVRSQVAAMNCQRQDGNAYCNGQHRQSDFYGGMDLWYWLISPDVSMCEIGKTPTTFLVDLYKQKNSQVNEKEVYIGSWQKGILACEPFFRLELVCRFRTS